MLTHYLHFHASQYPKEIPIHILWSCWICNRAHIWTFGFPGHYKWALDQLFYKHNFSRVIILEGEVDFTTLSFYLHFVALVDKIFIFVQMIWKSLLIFSVTLRLQQFYLIRISVSNAFNLIFSTFCWLWVYVQQPKSCNSFQHSQDHNGSLFMEWQWTKAVCAWFL